MTNSPSQGRKGMLVALVTSAFVVALPISALAHVAPSPAVIKPGVSATVSFTIPHGCSGSPTTRVEIKIPTGVSNAKAVAPKGWKATITNSIATFSGGSLPAKQKGSFTLTFTAPKKEGKLNFPTIQTCVKGKTSWIEPPPAGGGQADNPYPVVTVSSSPTAAAKTETTTANH